MQLSNTLFSCPLLESHIFLLTKLLNDLSMVSHQCLGCLTIVYSFTSSRVCTSPPPCGGPNLVPTIGTFIGSELIFLRLNYSSTIMYAEKSLVNADANTSTGKKQEITQALDASNQADDVSILPRTMTLQVLESLPPWIRYRRLCWKSALPLAICRQSRLLQ